MAGKLIMMVKERQTKHKIKSRILYGRKRSSRIKTNKTKLKSRTILYVEKIQILNLCAVGKQSPKVIPRTVANFWLCDTVIFCVATNYKNVNLPSIIAKTR
jgi:hypothetical protein